MESNKFLISILSVIVLHFACLAAMNSNSSGTMDNGSGKDATKEKGSMHIAEAPQLPTRLETALQKLELSQKQNLENLDSSQEQYDINTEVKEALDEAITKAYHEGKLTRTQYLKCSCLSCLINQVANGYCLGLLKCFSCLGICCCCESCGLFDDAGECLEKICNDNQKNKFASKQAAKSKRD